MLAVLITVSALPSLARTSRIPRYGDASAERSSVRAAGSIVARSISSPVSSRRRRAPAPGRGRSSTTHEPGRPLRPSRLASRSASSRVP